MATKRRPQKKIYKEILVEKRRKITVCYPLDEYYNSRPNDVGSSRFPLQYMTVFYDKFLLFFCGKHENNNSLEYENVSRECSATRLSRTQQKLLRKPWRTPFSLSDIFKKKTTKLARSSLLLLLLPSFCVCRHKSWPELCLNGFKGCLVVCQPYRTVSFLFFFFFFRLLPPWNHCPVVIASQVPAQ